MSIFKDRSFISFLIKFFVIFSICYYGTLGVIGLTVPGGRYVPFIHDHLDYVSAIRNSLLYGSKWLLSLFGYDTYIAGGHNLRFFNGRGIRIEYECVGYGVMSFWIAFVIASQGTLKRKIFWLLFGLLFIWLLNITRLSLLLLAINKGWPMPMGWDHHTWFNIFAYLFIFIFIWLFNRQPAPVVKEEPGKNKYHVN